MTSVTSGGSRAGRTIRRCRSAKRFCSMVPVVARSLLLVLTVVVATGSGPAAAPREAAPIRPQKRVFFDHQAVLAYVSDPDNRCRLVSVQRNESYGLEVELLYLDRPEPTPVQRGLEAFLAGELPAEKFSISFSDRFRHISGNGGVRITVLGTGQSTTEPIDAEPAPTRRLAPEEVECVVRLLLELRAWEQHTIGDRCSIGCGTSATVRIKVGDASSEIWELQGHLQWFDRIDRVGNLLKQLTGEGDRPPPAEDPQP